MPRARSLLAIALFLAVALAGAGCASVPDGAYFPDSKDPHTIALSNALYRAARAAGDDPSRYSFAVLATRDVSAYSAEDATFYFSEGLARQPGPVMEAIIAHEVAHEVLGHAGQRRALSLGLRAGFTVLGVVVPGAGLLDLALNPLIVRAFTRDQEIAADLKGAEILRSMGYRTPQRTMAEALRAVHAVNGRRSGGLLATEPSLDDRLAALEPLEPPAGETPATGAALRR